MREILFRGKRKDNGEWVEGFFVVKVDPLLGTSRCFILTQGYGESFVTWYMVDPATVGQYTGLKDKNGKRIFEGDVFEWGYAGVKEFRYVVVYDAVLASFVGERGGGFVRLNGIDIEISGNIHDKPELLKGGAEDG